MKEISILTLVILMPLYSCSERTKNAENKGDSYEDQEIIAPNFQSILDAANVEGAILVYDPQENTYYSNDFTWVKKGQLPASTFKIANSIIGLEIGVIERDSAIFKWDGKKRGLKSWEQDLVFKDAFHYSCVPCFQEVARKIGAKRMNDYLRNLSYGDMKVDSANIDTFWLEGDSQISQMQQINFLLRLYRSQLPISEQTEKIMKGIMVIEENDRYKLSGKTGLSIVKGIYNGWFVGYIELETSSYIFATNLEPKLNFDYATFIQQRIDVTFKAFEQMNLLN
ncbi:class D beta-lactamase [Pleomorphovibrio marinus]|uniref:class D beta-lactamase n=1 Tax=Pleomorphovibrio marinus TaxID=2164132 RepID=UPI000E0AAACB|nr:class D beta-lactamase [Pleomorphovibrio marinus]